MDHIPALQLTVNEDNSNDHGDGEGPLRFFHQKERRLGDLHPIGEDGFDELVPVLFSPLARFGEEFFDGDFQVFHALKPSLRVFPQRSENGPLKTPGDFTIDHLGPTGSFLQDFGHDPLIVIRGERRRPRHQFIETVFSDGVEIPKTSLFLMKKSKWAFAIAMVVAVVLGYGQLKSRDMIHPLKWLAQIRGKPSDSQSGDFGRVKVVVYPWATIHVDGKYATTTPTADPIVLPPGRHHLLFTHSTFGSRTMEIELKAGEERVIVVKMGS